MYIIILAYVGDFLFTYVYMHYNFLYDNVAPDNIAFIERVELNVDLENRIPYLYQYQFTGLLQTCFLHVYNYIPISCCVSIAA